MNPLGDPDGAWLIPNHGVTKYTDTAMLDLITDDRQEKLEVQREKADNAAKLLAEAEADLIQLQSRVRRNLEPLRELSKVLRSDLSKGIVPTPEEIEKICDFFDYYTNELDTWT